MGAARADVRYLLILGSVLIHRCMSVFAVDFLIMYANNIFIMPIFVTELKNLCAKLIFQITFQNAH